MSETTNFYRRPGPTSDPGRHRELVLDLRADALSTIVRGLLVHNFAAKIRGLPLSAERMSHMQTVGAEAILGNVISLDPRPLGLKRPAERTVDHPLDQPHGELDASLDILSRLAATAESVKTIKECFDLYPGLQPPADAVAR